MPSAGRCQLSSVKNRGIVEKPEVVTEGVTTSYHEMLWMLTKVVRRYFFGVPLPRAGLTPGATA